MLKSALLDASYSEMLHHDLSHFLDEVNKIAQPNGWRLDLLKGVRNNTDAVL
jgi:hypothetical protein